MQSRTINLKFITKTTLLCVLVGFLNLDKISAQEIIEDEAPEPKTVQDTLQNPDRIKVDGVANPDDGCRFDVRCRRMANPVLS